MSRPRRKRVEESVEVVGGTPPTASAVPAVGNPDAPTRVLALIDFKLGDVLRTEGQWFDLPLGRVSEFEASGWVASEARIAALWGFANGRILSPDSVRSHYTAADPGEGAVRVLHLTHYDPGSAVYRYHSAGNTVAGIQSAFARWGHSNPHSDLRQWDVEKDRGVVMALLMTADVVVSHMDYRVLEHHLNRHPLPHTRNFRLYHGSVGQDTPRKLVEHDKDAGMQAVQGGARLYHLRPTFGVKTWLPIPMPVKDYEAVAQGRDVWAGVKSGRKFRIAHSPTNRAIKGTDAFLSAVSYLAEHEGLPVEAVLIEGMEHGAAIRLKATCDASFDSFWLGIQGAGLEAGCMGQQVFAGDPEVVKDYTQAGIPVPYTYVHDRDGLVNAIRDAVTNPVWHQAEAARTAAYVREFHDYPKVGERLRRWLTER